MAATVTTASQNDGITLVTTSAGVQLQYQFLLTLGVDEGDYTNGEIYDLLRWKQGLTGQPDWYPKS